MNGPSGSKRRKGEEGRVRSSWLSAVSSLQGHGPQETKVEENDPDRGRTRWTYNAFGEVVASEDALGQITAYHYDPLGRIVQRISPERAVIWTYDEGEKAIGRLVGVDTGDGTTKLQTYDALGRLAADGTRLVKGSVLN